MKNIVVIDGAMNCAYDIFEVTDEEFDILFPNEYQDVCFLEDLESNGVNLEFLGEIWKRPIAKRLVSGIHGTMFIQFQEKKEFYPNLRDSDLDGWARPFSSADLG